MVNHETSRDLDALALEYQGDYGTAFRRLEVTDLMYNPFIKGIGGVLRLRQTEQSGNLPSGKIRVTINDGADPLLVAEDATQPLSEDPLL